MISPRRSLALSALFLAACSSNSETQGPAGPANGDDAGAGTSIDAGPDSALAPTPASLPTANDAGDDSGDTGVIVGGSRPAAVHVPPSYKSGVAMPLVVMLHGYTASGPLEELYLGITPLADSRGFSSTRVPGRHDRRARQPLLERVQRVLRLRPAPHRRVDLPE